MGINDRFRIVDTPERAPGQCFVCKSVSRGPFLDTGIDDFIPNATSMGTFYICVGCLGDFAACIDYDFKPKPQISEETQRDAVAESYFKSGWNAGVRTLMEDLNGLVANYLDKPIDPDAIPDSPGDLGDLSDPPVLSKDLGGQEGSGTSTGGTPEQKRSPAKRQGPVVVPSNSSDGSADDFRL